MPADKKPTEIAAGTAFTRRAAVTLMGALQGLAAQSKPEQPAILPPPSERPAVAGKTAAGVNVYDLLAMPGDRIITQEEHFGIINGRVSIGVNHRDVATLNGLYAPPYASSDFLIELRLFGEKVPTKEYEWRPIEVRRHGSIGGISVSTSTLLVSGMRAGILAVTLHNTSAKTQNVPVQLNITGDTNQNDARPGFDYVKYWGFSRPDTRKIKTSVAVEKQRVILYNTAGAIVVGADFNNPTWDSWSEWSSHWSAAVTVRPGERKTHYIAITLGPREESESAADHLLKDPGKTIQRSRDEYVRHTGDLLSAVPVFESSNALLSAYYRRSLQHLLLNRWEVPEFVLNPYYSTGSMKGGCVGCYLWDYGIVPELLPLFDPAAARAHIKQYLKVDIAKHFLFNPIDGAGDGPTYVVNQEKIIGCIYYYVLHTGDVQFLEEQVNGKSILEWVFFHATFGDALDQPALLIDYGEKVSHLELRHQYAYNHVLPDVNGMRYQTYIRASRLAAMAGKRREDIDARPGPLKELLTKKLWDAQNKWLGFMSDKGSIDLRYSNILFLLIGTGVLDKEQELGMLSHLNEKEFLSEYGLHSISKLDPAFDQADIDHGGGGSYVAFPAAIAEAFYKAGHVDQAEIILERTLWWAQRLPYWGDSIVANQIDYRHDTPLQCAVDAAAGAQCMIFGMCGIKAEPNGDIVVNPRPPKFSPQISLHNLKIRGHRIDVVADRRHFDVRVDGHNRSSAIGVPVVIPAASGA